MRAYHCIRRLWRAALVIASTSVMLSSNCTTSDLRAIAVGLDSASQELDRNQQDQHQTFGEWLLDELNH